MCPSPGLVHRDQVTTHQKSHSTALFTCAACDLKYERYLDVESHIKVRHKVAQASSIRESIRLPDRELLVSMECGVCHKLFVGQGEQVLISHIESTHGKYYVAVGGGKNLFRLCRICDELFTDGVMMQKHLDGVHSPGLFANDSDGEDEIVDTRTDLEPVAANDGENKVVNTHAAVEPVVTANSNSGKVAFMDIFKEEVAKRKAEYDAQEAETKRLRKLLVTDSSDSDEDEVVEVKRRKRVKQSKKMKKSRRRACSSDEEYDRKYSGHGSTPSSGNSVPYSKYKTHLSYSSNAQYQDDDSTHNIDLRTSSTLKLLKAKEMVRQSIQKEENRRRGALYSTSSFEDDLRKMKMQLTETLRKSRQLTDKYSKDDEGGNLEEGRGISIDDDKSSKSVPSVLPTQVEPLARPKFKMTWKK